MLQTTYVDVDVTYLGDPLLLEDALGGRSIKVQLHAHDLPEVLVESDEAKTFASTFDHAVELALG